MEVCIDTNTILQARKPSHRFFCILDAVVAGRITWVVSNRVVTEYEEITFRSAGTVAWQNLRLLMELIDQSGQLRWISPHYQFRVISADPDDNAFTDCAIAAHADYIITEDRDFAPLANAGYKPQPITPDEFIAKYRGIHV